MAKQLHLFEETLAAPANKVVNVASVPQRSPFRYPGGKTWLIPTVRQWLRQASSVTELIEPFAGGGIVSLTAAFEQLAQHITMVELDEEVAAAWQVMLSDKNGWLAEKILHFELTHTNIRSELENPAKEIHDLAFCTILKNRVFHGGILAKGSGLLKNGENGKGIASRWYAKTLWERITALQYVKNKISFHHGDAFATLLTHASNPECYFFIDPPYTVAGKRLYTHHDLDHGRLLALVSRLKGKFMMTYDDVPEIRALAIEHGLDFRTIPMKTTHHLEKNELILSDNFDWWGP